MATPKQERRVPSFLTEEEMAGFLGMPPSEEPLDLRDRRNYPTFLAGIATEIAAVLILTAIGFTVVGVLTGDIHEYTGENAFLPAAGVHIFDWCLAAVLVALLNVLVVWVCVWLEVA